MQEGVVNSLNENQDTPKELHVSYIRSSHNLAALVLVSLLSGCGGDNGNDNGNDNNPNPVAPTSQPLTLVLTLTITSSTNPAVRGFVRGAAQQTVRVAGQLVVDVQGGNRTLQNVMVELNGQGPDGPFTRTEDFGTVFTSATRGFVFTSLVTLPLPDPILRDLVLSGTAIDGQTEAPITTTNPPIDIGPDPFEGIGFLCEPGAVTACILDNQRFQIEIEWRDFNGNTGLGMVMDSGRVTPTIADAAFYFFDPNMQDVLMQVINACDQNGYFEVSLSSTTTVEFTMTVTDTSSGQTRSYRNPLGEASPPLLDTQAFATCSYD